MSLGTQAACGADLDPLEIHAGIPLNGRRTPPPPSIAVDIGEPPDRVLERLLLPALEREPCMVAYSGGRDSSALLAAATRAARRHGLADPIPVTFAFARFPRTDEREWQELTVRHLGLSDWQRMELDTELDVVGPVAQTALKRHGLYWPPNAHNLVPLLEAARGGTLLTGNGGDELFSPWSWRRIAQIRRGQARPTQRDLRYLALSFTPTVLRRLLFPVISSFGLPWLKRRAMRELRRRYAVDMGFRPWLRESEHHVNSRYREVSHEIFQALARDAGTVLFEPLFDPAFVHAVARHVAPYGFAGREDAMRTLFGELLPPELITRATKAVFTEVSVGPYSRRFVEKWDGAGVDHSLVDEEAVRRMWNSERPALQSLTMLQSAWLAKQN